MLHHEATGSFLLQVSEWFRMFNRQQVLVMSYSEFRDKPERYLERVRDFLGLRPSFKGEQMIGDVNSKDSPLKIVQMKCSTYKKLMKLYAKEEEGLHKLLSVYKLRAPPMEQRPFPRFADTGNPCSAKGEIKAGDLS